MSQVGNVHLCAIVLFSSKQGGLVDRKDVFVSYRREGGENLAGRIHDSLVKRGYQVFLDVESLHSGRFNEKLLEAIENAAVFILICTPGCFDRCADEGDWVRWELRHALSYGIKVIPILTEGFDFPDVLPPDIDDVRHMTGLKHHHDYYRELIDKLCERLSEYTKPQRKIKVLLITMVLFVAGLIVLAVIVTLNPTKTDSGPEGESTAVTQDSKATGNDEKLEDTGEEPLPPLSVTSSRIQPYASTGSYSTSLEDTGKEGHELSVDRAFSIVSILEKNGTKNALVESTRMDITSLERIEEPDVVFDAEIKDNTLYIFAINNGWGDANDRLSFGAQPGRSYSHPDGAEERGIALEDVCKDVSTDSEVDLKAAGIARVAKLEFDVDGFQSSAYGYKTNAGKDSYELTIDVRSPSSDVLWFATIIYTNQDGFFFSPAGGRDYDTIDHSVTLFSVLDVDNPNSSIVFTGAEASPLVEDKVRVETILAPTKSCRLTCRNVFSLEGTEQSTDEYSVDVVVCAYDDLAGVGYRGRLVAALMEEPDAANERLTQIGEGFLYDPDSIRVELEQALMLGGATEPSVPTYMES